jgi:hypothetical protein
MKNLMRVVKGLVTWGVIEGSDEAPQRPRNG